MKRAVIYINSSMRPLFQFLTRPALFLGLLATILLSGCGAPAAPPQATTPVDKIEQIKNNSALPPAAKAAAIAQEQAKLGSSPAK